MKHLLVTVLLILLGACACKKIQYTNDLGFMNSAQANSPEFLVKINGSFCKDMDGGIGLCAKRIKSNEAIKFILDKRPYSYRLNVDCSSVVDFKLSVDVLKDSSFSFSIPPDRFLGSKSFTCVGEVFPQDRKESVSAFWHTRFVIIDHKYSERESIYQVDDVVVLGQHAKHSLINEEISVKNKATFKVKKLSKAYSESELMRFNYWGY